MRTARFHWLFLGAALPGLMILVTGQLSKSTALTLLGVAVMLLASGLVASRFNGALLRAIRQLTSAAADVQDGTASTELRIEGSHEVVQLAQQFDRLLKARRQTEEALHRSEEILRIATRASMIGVYSVDCVTNTIDWSPELRAIFGWSAEEPVTDEKIKQAVYPDDRHQVMAAIRRSRDPASAGATEMELRIVRRDGQVRWISARSHTEFAGDGKLRHAVRQTGTAQDVSARRQGEQLLRESEQKLRGLFELSPLGIALTDMKGRYVEFNEAFQRICGYTDQEIKALDYWKMTPKEYESQEARQLESLRLTGKYGPYEKEYVRKDGSRVPLVLNGE